MSGDGCFRGSTTSCDRADAVRIDAKLNSIIFDPSQNPKSAHKAKPLDARAVRFSEPRRGYAWSLAKSVALQLKKLASDRVFARYWGHEHRCAYAK
jgi:hypothetical protein